MNTKIDENLRQATDSEVIQEVSNWLIDQGLKSADFESILSGFCERLVAAGVPVARGMIAMRTLHPSVDAETFVWNQDGPMSSSRIELDQREEGGWRQSPLYYMLDSGEHAFRRCLTGDAARIDYPILGQLRAEGFTDYHASVVPFEIVATDSEENGLISSWAARAPGGFSDSDIAVMDRLLPRLALTAKATLTREIAETMLDTYVGPEAGRRIMAGDIHRGSLDVIRAVLLFADLRGFTAISDTIERDALAPMLDAYFDHMVPPVVDHGGQVLKFMGDGLLATFDLAGTPKDSVCSQALQAGWETITRVRALNHEREAEGLPVMQLDIAMHLGDVLYGNVGAADRQDFTVIGPAVNEASRIEVLCQDLGHNLLISETFAEAAVACTGRLIPVGRHRLRGVRESQALYTIDISG